MKKLTIRSFLFACIPLISHGADKLNNSDRLLLSTKEIFVAVVEFPAEGAINPTKEKRLQIEYDGKKSIYGLESIKIVDPIYTSLGIELQDGRFLLREKTLSIPQAWGKEMQLRVNIRQVPISHNPAIVVFTYSSNFPKTPIIVRKIYDINDRKEIEELLQQRFNWESKLRANASRLFDELGLEGNKEK
jgi:hypothetical protein